MAIGETTRSPEETRDYVRGKPLLDPRGQPAVECEVGPGQGTSGGSGLLEEGPVEVLRLPVHA